MTAIRSLLGGSIAALVLAACSAPPPCRVAPEFVDDRRVNGICLVAVDERVLLVHHRASGKYDLPGGRRKRAETAQCAAHRETWEETGLDVVVGPLVATFWSAALYRCDVAGTAPERLTTASAVLEISDAEWVDPALLAPGDWRFEDRALAVRAALGR